MHIKSFIFPILFFLPNYLFSQSSPFIHVDQFGYFTNAVKVAVISDPQVGYNAGDSFTPSALMEIRDATTDAIVFSAAPAIWDNGNTHTQSGDKGWWFDFSSFTTPGSYYVYDPDNDESSAEFDINDQVYDEVLKAISRAFFYNRCYQAKNAPHAETGWTDGTSFAQDANTKYIYDPDNASLEKDLIGGWFDAGDYNKYVTFTLGTLHNLLWAYQESPAVFTDAWNIPESGNGIPDIIDEIKWELDWLLKMTNTDGSAHIKMGSANHSENSAAPPSANTDPRYYGPTCTSASITVASVFAHAAIVLGDFSSLTTYAQTLETKAEDAWAYVLPFLDDNTLETDCDNGSIVSGDADLDSDAQYEAALGAAIYLFALTGDATYHQYVIDHIDDAYPMNSGDWNNYRNSIQSALLYYTTLSGNDPLIESDILNSITTAVTNNWNDYFGFSSADLYRAYMPGWTYHWGSNRPKANFGNLNHMLLTYGINPGSAADYELKMTEQMHYFHGVNPQGIVYLSNMYDKGGEHCVNEIFHLWYADGTDWDNALTSLYGPAPGYISGGPNANYNADVSLEPPFNQPLQKSYLDWNTGWPENSWEVTEPAIYYQAAYLRLLSGINADIPVPVEWLDHPRATIVGDDVRIDWSTATESNNDHFVVEHSLNGKTFVPLSTVAGKGDTELTQSYRFFHRKVGAGHHYYRIKQVDHDGSYQYSPMMSVRVRPKTEWQLYPNPVADQFTLTEELSDYFLKIYNNNGTQVYVGHFTGTTHIVNTHHLPKGGYFAKIGDIRNGEITVLKFVK